MNEGHVKHAIRYAKIMTAADIGFKLGVCPICGITSMVSRKADGGYCYNCNKWIDIDEVIEHDRS